MLGGMLEKNKKHKGGEKRKTFVGGDTWLALYRRAARVPLLLRSRHTATGASPGTPTNPKQEPAGPSHGGPLALLLNTVRSSNDRR